MCFTIEVHLTRKAIEERFSVDASTLYDFDYNYFYRAFDHPMIPVVTQEEPRRVQEDADRPRDARIAAGADGAGRLDRFFPFLGPGQMLQVELAYGLA